VQRTLKVCNYSSKQNTTKTALHRYSRALRAEYCIVGIPPNTAICHLLTLANETSFNHRGANNWDAEPVKYGY